MLLKELKSEHLAAVKKITADTARQIRKSTDKVSLYTAFCVYCLAYWAADNQIKDTRNLMKYVEEKLDKEQGEFIWKNINDLWYISIKLSGAYPKEDLKAASLLFTAEGEHSMGRRETPGSIIKLAGLILAGTDETVADFCCGSGLFLLGVQDRDDNSSYFGVEINAADKEIAAIKMSMVSDRAKIERGSVFAIESNRKFDKIFCDFPWGCRTMEECIDREEIKPLVDMIPELQDKTAAGWLFVVNVMYHLKHNGKAVVVVPNGMTSGGGIDRAVRKQIIRLGMLEAVIALPGKLYSTTSTAVSLLVLSRNNKSIRMIDAGVGEVKKGQNVLSDDVAAEIVSLMEKDADNSVRVFPEEMGDCDYVIYPAAYFSAGTGIKYGDRFETVMKNMTRGAQTNAFKLEDLASDVPTEIQYLLLTGIQDGIISDELPYLKKLDSKLEKYCIRDNSLIISKNGPLVKIAVASVREGHKILASGNMYVIELDERRVNPYFLKAYLESEQGTKALAQIMVGAALPNIPVDSLRKLVIPLPPMEEQNLIAEKYQAKEDEVRVLKGRLAAALAELRSIYGE